MNSIGIQLRISDLLFAVQKRWKIILSLTFLGLVSGLLLSGLSYIQSSADSYQVSGSFMIAATDSRGMYTSNNNAPNRNDIILAEDMYDTVYYLLQSDRLLNQVINDEQMLGVSIGDIRSNLSISRYYETTIITMTFSWEENQEALSIWNAILKTGNTLLSEIVEVGSLRIINEPTSKVVGSRSSNMKTWMVLPVLGLVAGISFSIIEMLMRPTLINVKDVETVFGLETIGIIPYDEAHFANKGSILVKDEKASPEVLQNYSAAAYILRNRLGTGGQCQCLYITSTTRREGRTTAAANLAIQLSDLERHTLLIDFDYKSPSLGLLFLNNLDYRRSLNALYRGEINVAEAITTLTGYLDILPMVMEHNLISMDGAIIDMISQLKQEYEYIIIDAPPVGTESETLRLNTVANTVLFVARYDTASIPEIQATLDKLDKSGIRIAGCIVNGVKSTRNVLLGSETASQEEKKNKNKKKKRKTGKGTGKKKKNAAEIKENDKSLKMLTRQAKETEENEKPAEEGAAAAEAAAAAGEGGVQPAGPDGAAAENTVQYIVRQAELPPDMTGNLETPEEPPEAPPEKAPEKPPEKKKRGLFGRKEPSAKKPAEKKKEEPSAGKKAPPAGKTKKTSAAGRKSAKSKGRASNANPLGELSMDAKPTTGDPFEDALSGGSTVISKSRNIFEDLMDEPEITAKSDDEMAQALFQMGLDGSWENSGKNKEEENP